MLRLASTAAAAAIVVATVALSPNFRTTGDRERNPYAGDFLQEWVGGWTVRAGDRSRLYDPAYTIPLQHDESLLGFRLRRDGFIPMVYPPVYYLAVSPLSLLPYRPAAWVWSVLSLATFVAVVTMLGRAFAAGGTFDALVAVSDAGWRRVAPIAGAVALPAAVAFMPFAENFVSSQKGTLWLFLVTTTLLALVRGHPGVAGVVFGLQMVKPQLAFVLPCVMLAKRQWRFVAGFAATTAALIVASAAMGRDLALAYLRFAADASNFIRHGEGYRHRLHSLYGFFTLLAGEPTTTARLATAAAWVGVAVLLARALRGPLGLRTSRFLLQLSAVVVATLLVSPHVLTYDLTLLLLPFALLGFMILRGAVTPGRRRALLWSVVATYAVCGVSPSIAARTGLQVSTLALGALLWVIASEAARQAASRPLTRPAEARHTS